MKARIGKPRFNKIFHIIDKEGNYLCGFESLVWLRLKKEREIKVVEVSELDSYKLCKCCRKYLQKVLAVLII